MDWEDKEDIDIREGDVNVYVYQFGETVLKRVFVQTDSS